VGELPQTAPGSGIAPTGLNGNVANTFAVENLTGNVGNSTAAGNVLAVSVPSAGNFQLADFETTLNAGLLTADTVIVAFDFLAKAGVTHDGFAFMRGYDDTFESIADIAFGFGEDFFTLGLLDYDPATGEYLGWLEPDFPTNYFELGTWHRIEQVIDLNNNVQTLRVDGQEYGITAGVSRATGQGYQGSFFNWGAAYVGNCAIDNITIEIVTPADDLPEPPPGFLDLFNVETHGGQVLTIPQGTFNEVGVDWETSGNTTLIYDPVYNGIPSYTFVFDENLNEADARLFSFNTFPIQPNRTYEVSALIRTDFPRATWEINWGFHGANGEEEISPGGRYSGMPAKTEGPDGWERFTWRFTPHWDASYEEVIVFLGFHEYGPGFDDDVLFQIADLAIVELPEVELAAFPPGGGVTFPGGPGNLPMAVENITQEGNLLTATVTSADYVFDLSAGTLEVHQRIDYERLLARYEGLPLSGLAVQSQEDDLAILVGDELTIGLQADGALVISPHNEMSITSTSVIGGDFNRLDGGDFFSLDDFGGFTTSIYTPKGTGRISQLTPITADLPFVGLNAADLETAGAAEADWQASLDVVPGERIFISAFPSRPYDWEKSFDYYWALSDWNAALDDYDNPDYVTAWILWNINQRGWAMSFGERYELRENVPAQAHMDAITNEGDAWAAYFSQWFYYSRDGEEWANEVKRWRDEYGMTAMYSDGLAEDDFLSAYIAMRVLREDVFPDGNIIIHDSYPQSGVPTANYKPFIHTYATTTYMGEFAIIEAQEEWEWARHVMGQFRRANCFGVTKGDRWEGFNNVNKYLVALVWGGRARPDVANFDTYLDAVAQLKTLWETYGDDYYFFDRYYHPEAQILTGYNIGRAGMPIDQFNTDQTELTLSTWTPGATIHYTLDGSEPTLDSPEYTGPVAWAGTYQLRARAFRMDLDESRVFELDGDMVTSSTTIADNEIVPQLLSVQPNPATFQTTIRYFLPEASTVDVRLISLTGQTVKVLDNGPQAAGYHLQEVETSELVAGLYFIRLSVEGKPLPVRRLVVAR
ncbi:MAG: chitobiase/beta-hexosaminidase C-terminal domain-containing protein, partial [Bacteroidota bacterium]